VRRGLRIEFPYVKLGEDYEIRNFKRYPDLNRLLLFIMVDSLEAHLIKKKHFKWR